MHPHPRYKPRRISHRQRNRDAPIRVRGSYVIVERYTNAVDHAGPVLIIGGKAPLFVTMGDLPTGQNLPWSKRINSLPDRKQVEPELGLVSRNLLPRDQPWCGVSPWADGAEVNYAENEVLLLHRTIGDQKSARRSLPFQGTRWPLAFCCRFSFREYNLGNPPEANWFPKVRVRGFQSPDLKRILACPIPFPACNCGEKKSPTAIRGHSAP